MTKKTSVSLVEILKEIKDFRNKNLTEYSLEQILLIFIIGVLSGYTHTFHIYIFAKSKKAWFKKNLNLKRIPSRQTLERVLNFISFIELESALSLWLEEIFKHKQIRKRLQIDAKKTDKNSTNPTTFIRAFLSDIKMVVGSRRIKEYEGEIKALPKLINKLLIKGFLVSIDAIGTQTKVIDLLLLKGAHYLLPVKKNQRLLYEDLMLYSKSETPDSTCIRKDNKHGRKEKRIFNAFYNVKWIHKRFPKWKHIISFGILKRSRTENTKNTTCDSEVLFISSKLLTAKDYLFEIREHWAIENNLHWTLNQSFKEDKILSRSRNFINNFSLILSFCLSLTAKDKQKKVSFNVQKILYSTGLKRMSKLLNLKV